MAAKTTTFNNISGLNKALRKLPKEASKKLRDASVAIAAKEAPKAAAKARSVGGVAALVAPSIRATRDRVPVIKMGGAKRLRPGPRQTVGDIIWGAEFGGQRRPTTQQFSPWTGSGTTSGRFLYPTIRNDADAIHDEYSGALLDALEDTK